MGRDDERRRDSGALTRRQFIAGSASLGVLVVTGCDDEAGQGSPDTLDADAADTGIDMSWIDDLDTRREDTFEPTDVVDASEVADGADADAADIEEVDVEGPPFNPDGWNESPGTFPHGVQAGAMRESSVVLWSYFSPAEPRLVRVWREDPDGPGPLVSELEVAPNEVGACKVLVEGLQPGQRYGYAFFDDPALRRSVKGRFRTAFAPGTLAPLTIGATTCTSWENAPYEALSLMAREELDCFVHLGDMVYTDYDPTARTLDEYRAKWLDTLDIQGYADLTPTVGCYHTWDDHEIANNLNPETEDPARIEAAKTAFFENLPNEEGPDHRLWTSFRWGDTAEIFILDCRSERLPSTRTSDDAVYISPEQMQWLQEGLLASPCHFKVLLNSVPITDMPLAYDVMAADRWEGYASQRAELLDFIEANEMTNVWFLSGDFHLGFVSHVGRSGYSAGLIEIAVGPGGNGPNPLAFVPHPEPQFAFLSPSGKATTVLTFDPIEDTVRAVWVDAESEEVLHDVEYHAGV